MKHLRSHLIPILLLLTYCLPTHAQLQPDRHPVLTFYPDLAKIDAWVKDRGCTGAIFPLARIYGGTWEDLHEKIVPNLWAEGHSFGVIRPPAFVIGRPPEFDQRHRQQLLAYCLPDELEDKQEENGVRLNMPRDAAKIGPKILALIRQYRAADSTVPLFCNFNGNHLVSPPRPEVEAMYRSILAEIDIACMDNWQGTALNYQHADGTLRYSLNNRFEAWERLRAWTPPHKRVLGFIDTCSQELPPKDPIKLGMPEGTIALPSRAPTAGEVRLMDERFKEGFALFHIQPTKGRNSVVAPELEPVLEEISNRRNPPGRPDLWSRIRDLEAENLKLKAWQRRLRDAAASN